MSLSARRGAVTVEPGGLGGDAGRRRAGGGPRSPGGVVPPSLTITPTIADAELLLGGGWPISPGDDVVARIYLAVVRQARPSRSALLDDGFTPAEIDYALLLLGSRGLVGPCDPLVDVIDVPSPEVTLPRYAAALERQAVTSRSAVQGLTHAYRTARAERPETLTAVGIGLLGSAEEIAQARQEVLSLARTSVLQVFALGPGNQDEVLGLADRLAEAAQAPGGLRDLPDRRAVFDAAVLEVDGALETLDRLSAAGVEVRIAPRVPCSGLVSDQAALADLSHLDPSGFGSMLLRHRPLLQVVRVIAEGLHEGAAPLSRVLAREEPQHWLDDRDRQILVLIAAGATDTMIARQVRISQRTVERRLRAIMDELGATTRFQAGVQAAKRGLV